MFLNSLDNCFGLKLFGQIARQEVWGSFCLQAQLTQGLSLTPRNTTNQWFGDLPD